MAFDWLDTALDSKKQDGYLRTRAVVEYEKDGIICINGAHYLNFASNDYLGMRHDEGVLQTWVEGLAQFGGSSGASPLVTGYTQAHQALEAYLAEHLNREAVLLFNSGFAANQAVCQALFGQHNSGDGLIVADKYMHASFIDGALACNATLRRFRHNDMQHAEQILAKHHEADCLIASEGVFSMDGDSAPLDELIALSQAHNSWLMLDDAHGFGVLGTRAMGSAEHYQLTQQQVPLVMGTFGKAVGTAGAFVAGSQALIDYLVNEARHYIYSTAMPPAQALATLYALQHIPGSGRQQQLQDNIAAFRQRAEQAGLALSASASAIQPVVIGDPDQTLALADALKARGIWVGAIRYPTVPKATDRLRITLSSSHTRRDIEALVDALALAREAMA